MRIVFFGTSSFSAGILEFLCQKGIPIVAVVTRPDRLQGRSLKMGSSPVKQLVLSSYPDIPLFQPEKASTAVFCEQLRALNPDLFLVVAYGEILKENVLSIPLKGCVNIHTSLLPKYRGASPIQSCLMRGDGVSGVTFMEMVLKMDAGDILKQEKVAIGPDFNAVDLEALLLEAAKKALPDLLSHFDFYKKNKKPQEENEATFVAKITPQDCIPDWDRTVEQLHNQVRALSPSPGVFIQLQFGSELKRLKILKTAKEFSLVESPGKLYVDRNGIKVSCANGFLVLLLVQLEGKKAMKAEEFLRGVSKQISLVS